MPRKSEAMLATELVIKQNRNARDSFVAMQARLEGIQPTSQEAVELRMTELTRIKTSIENLDIGYKEHSERLEIETIEHFVSDNYSDEPTITYR